MAGPKHMALKEIDIKDVLIPVMKVPLVKINRSKFLRKELRKYYPRETVDKAVEYNPAYAGIKRGTINKIAKDVINYETKKVTALSFAAGLPGGFAMVATVPADMTQYFTFILRVMQKLAYLYGFEEFDFDEENVDDETMDIVFVFLGVMFGVQGANATVKKLAEATAKHVAHKLAQKALTKGTLYPIVKKIATALGVRMTKQIFADSVSHAVPVAGGMIAGGMTYATFKPNANRLKKSFMELNLSDPDFYRSDEINQEEN